METNNINNNNNNNIERTSNNYSLNINYKKIKYNNNNNKKIPNYLIKEILNLVLINLNNSKKLNVNNKIIKTIYLISRVCKEWNEKIIPYLELKEEFVISKPQQIYEIYFMTIKYKIIFKSVYLNCNYTSDILDVVEYLIDKTSISASTATNNFLVRNKKEYLKYEDLMNSRTIQDNKELLNRFLISIKELVVPDYEIRKFVFSKFTNIEKLTINYNSHQKLEESLSLAGTYKINGEFEFIDRNIKQLTIHINGDIDFSEATLKSLIGGLQSLESFKLKSVSNSQPTVLNSPEIIKYQSSNLNFKKMVFKCCSPSQNEIENIFQRNISIETFGFEVNNEDPDILITRLTNDQKIKSLKIYDNYITFDEITLSHLQFSTLITFLNNNKTINTLKFYNIINFDSTRFISDFEQDLEIFNDHLLYLELFHSSDIVLLEKSQFTKLNTLKCGISQELIQHITNFQSLEYLELRYNEYDKKYRNLNFYLSLKWNQFFNKIISTNYFNNLKELIILPLISIDKYILSDLILSNHKNLIKLDLNLFFFNDDWFEILNSISLNKYLKSIELNCSYYLRNNNNNNNNNNKNNKNNNTYFYDESINFTQPIINILKNNKSLEYLNLLAFQFSKTLTEYDISNISKEFSKSTLKQFYLSERKFKNYY